MSDIWSDEKYLEEAKREPERLVFWRKYNRTELEASKSVCDNPPRFDKQFARIFPDPVRYLEEYEDK